MHEPWQFLIFFVCLVWQNWCMTKWLVKLAEYVEKWKDITLRCDFSSLYKLVLLHRDKNCTAIWEAFKMVLDKDPCSVLPSDYDLFMNLSRHSIPRDKVTPWPHKTMLSKDRLVKLAASRDPAVLREHQAQIHNALALVELCGRKVASSSTVTLSFLPVWAEGNCLSQQVSARITRASGWRHTFPSLANSVLTDPNGLNLE